MINFPFSEYQIINVPEQAQFYLDNIDDCIKNVLKNKMAWEGGATREIFSTYVKSGSVVIDVGAHIGTHTIVMSRYVGEQGKIIAFEPQKKIFRELYYNIRLNGVINVDLYNCALGNREGEVFLGGPIQGNEGARFVVGEASNEIAEKVIMRKLDSLSLRDVSL